MFTQILVFPLFGLETSLGENLAIGAISPLRRCAIDRCRARGRAFSPIPGRMTELMGDPAGIDRILGARADRAVAIAKPIPARTYEIVGFVRSR